MEDNLKTYNQVAEEYTDYALTPAEVKILHRFRGDWHNTKMLDIGVGTGRTSHTFSALVKCYTGIDYSASMVSRCQQVIEQSPSCKIELCDATNLSAHYGSKFDFILFSLNGIDSVEHEQRLAIFSEVKQVIDEKGHFFFSTHSLYSFPFRPRSPKFQFRRLLHSVYYQFMAFKFNYRLNRHYKSVDEASVLADDFAILVNGDHDFQMGIYHIKPSAQIAQLQEAGFDVLSVYSQAGQLIDPDTYVKKGYMYFLCKASSSHNHVSS